MLRPVCLRRTIGSILAIAVFAVAGGRVARGEPVGLEPSDREPSLFVTPPESAPEAPGEPRPRGDLPLARALAAALEGSPVLGATALEIRRREALALQAGLLPNPVLEVSAEDFVGDSQKKSLGYQQTTVSLAQLVELGGKRGARKWLALRDRDVAARDFEVTRVAVLTDATKAFLLVLAIQERRALLEELEGLAAESVRSVAATVRAGAVSAVEEDRALVNLERVRLERARVANDLASARALLAATWGQSEATFDAVTGDLWSVPSIPDWVDLAAVVSDAPEISRWNAEIERREAALSLERANRIPDLEVSIAGRHHPLGDAGGVVAGFSIPLQLFDRNQGNVLAAQQELARARAEGRRLDVSTRTLLAARHQALVIAHREVETLRDQIIPRAERVFAQTRVGYARGLFRYVEVLDAQRTLFEARREILAALLALHVTATDLERLTGHPLASLGQGNAR